MNRREFISLLGGGAAALPLAARAQQPGVRVRRIGVLTNLPSDDAEAQLRNAAFLQGLQELGWMVGRNLRIDFRWVTPGDAGRLREYAAELVALAPEVILAVGVTSVVELQQTTRTMPMVFVQVSDPVGAGFVANLARPGGNITGFTLFEYGLSAKWVELLKEIAPGITRMAVLRDPSNPSGTGQFGAIQAVAGSFRVDLTPVDMRDPSEIEAAVGAFARGSKGGMIVLPQGMRELGYAEGRDYGLEVRYADGDVHRIPLLTEEVFRLRPDVLVQGTMGGVIAARKLTDSIPIVSEVLTDPVGFGVAASHARPGGNVTGVLVTVEDLPTKLLALAAETVPGVDKIGLLINSDNPIQPLFRRSLEGPARALGVELVAAEAASRDDLQPALKRLARDGAKIVLALQDTMFLNERKRIALFATAERLPTVFGFRENVDDGGLMSYGTDLRESWRRIATFVDKILKGAKPGDLPIEFPTKVQLVINLTAAKALGLEIPPTLLARADEVIE